MIVLEDKNISYEEICDLTKSVDWGRRYYPTEAIFRYVMQATAHVGYVRENNRLLGYGRVVADGMHCMFYDICVHPDYQNQGLGFKIMQHLIGKIKDKNYVTVGLFCEPDNATVIDFYKKMRFESVAAMELKRLCRQNWD